MQLLIPRNSFHAARVVGSCRWFLGASTEWPGVEPADVDSWAEGYPDTADDLRAFQKRRGD